MDRGLLTRALIIGFVCFILVAGGLYYLSIMDERATRQSQVMTSTLSNRSDDIGPSGY
jgi:hypothetical protein